MMSNDKNKCFTCPNRENGIFCGIDTLSLEKIGQHNVVNDYKKGSTLFYQGSPRFGITKVGNDGKESIVRIAKNGDVLGDRSVFSHENYTSNGNYN
jgi:CRP-like cAMP-binding protein